MPGNSGPRTDGHQDSGTNRSWSCGPRPSNAVCGPHVEDRPSGRMSITNNTEQRSTCRKSRRHIPRQQATLLCAVEGRRGRHGGSGCWLPARSVRGNSLLVSCPTAVMERCTWTQGRSRRHRNWSLLTLGSGGRNTGTHTNRYTRVCRQVRAHMCAPRHTRCPHPDGCTHILLQTHTHTRALN